MKDLKDIIDMNVTRREKSEEKHLIMKENCAEKKGEKEKKMA